MRSASDTSSGGRAGSGPSRSGGGSWRTLQAARAPSRAAASKLNGRWVGPRSSGSLHSARVAARVAALEVAGVVGLQRVPGQDRLAHRRRGRAVGGVEQLAERDGGWATGAGVLVGAGVGDDDVLGRGEQRVEQAAGGPRCGASRSPVSGRRSQHVVAVDGAAAREHPVVESDQAHDAVRDRAHRHHRADGERAGAEVGARRSAGQPGLQQRADVGAAAARVRRPRTTRPHGPARARAGAAARRRPRRPR